MLPLENSRLRTAVSSWACYHHLWRKFGVGHEKTVWIQCGARKKPMCNALQGLNKYYHRRLLADVAVAAATASIISAVVRQIATVAVRQDPTTYF
jgi:hypothetical protein